MSSPDPSALATSVDGPLDIADPISIDRLRSMGAVEFASALAAKSLYPDSQFEVILVRGPNRRNDFHVDPYDEFFVQIEGTIRVDTREQGKVRRHHVDAGEVFLVPGGVPHSPLRPAGTWGLVVEVRRVKGEQELVEWYCDRCDALIERIPLSSAEMITALAEVLGDFEASKARRTCRGCGAVLAAAEPFVLDRPS
jgi:3-hydroxyanthranilate 3,4-dioxygenase